MSSANATTIAAGRQEIMAAVQVLWHAFHPELPPVSTTWGKVPARPPAIPCHLRSGPWRDQLTLTDVHAAQGAQRLIEDLRHEAGHGLASARGIKDSSGPSDRYHNEHYRTLAGEVGLVVAEDDWEARRGWWKTTPDEATASTDLQSEAGRRLAAALEAYQPADLDPAPASTPKRLRIMCHCSDAGFALHVTLARFNRGRITCNECNHEFQLVDTPSGATAHEPNLP